MKLTITVLGLPAPQGSKKFVGLSKAGRGLMVESSKKVKPWRKAVEDAARLAMDAHIGQDPTRFVATHVMGLAGFSFPLDGPLRLRLHFTMPKPSSAPKRRVTYPMRMPDLSKLVRSTEDALTLAGVWADDARVVECLAVKCYPLEHPHALERPGVRIEVEPLA